MSWKHQIHILRSLKMMVWALMPLLSSCATYPLGLSEEQWNALTPGEQAESRMRQADLDAEAMARLAAERQERERMAHERALAGEERLRAAYAEARYGDVITVTISGGMVAFNGKHHLYEPIAFDLVRGETKWVVFRRLDKRHATTEIEVFLSEDGNTFIFDVPARQRFVVLRDASWTRGVSYPVPEATDRRASRSEARGVAITIRLRHDLPGGRRGR